MPRIFQVDAFSDRPFGGNPAAVCILDGAAEVSWMQNVAAEMNLAETAFVFPENGHFRLRWFTPKVEVDLCGHATLATAHILWHVGAVATESACVFVTRSGELQAIRIGEKIQLDFPAAPVQELDLPKSMALALGAKILYSGTSKFDFMVELESAEVVRNLNPDIPGLAETPMRGIIVTAKDESGEFDFVSRFFGPAVGIDEDPVTGSAHCTLGPYWQSKIGKNEFNAWQASERGGGMHVTIEGDRVKLTGQAVTIFEGELHC